jgi:hypothetical protein
LHQARLVIDTHAELSPETPFDVWVNACAHVGLIALVDALLAEPKPTVH